MAKTTSSAAPHPPRIVVPLAPGDDLVSRLDDALDRLNGHPRWKLVHLSRAALIRMILDHHLAAWVEGEFRSS